jgi:hypothetical protein
MDASVDASTGTEASTTDSVVVVVAGAATTASSVFGAFAFFAFGAGVVVDAAVAVFSTTGVVVVVVACASVFGLTVFAISYTLSRDLLFKSFNAKYIIFILYDDDESSKIKETCGFYRKNP